jgi:hypothetical protein
MKWMAAPLLVMALVAHAVSAPSLFAFVGCQTWTGGMTLPSPRYLQHTPQYIPSSPPFPLPH